VSLREIDDEGWAQMELEITGALDGAMQALQVLTERGVVPARFERVGSSLGELMQRVTGQTPGGSRA
jgi:hypothetical protein